MKKIAVVLMNLGGPDHPSAIRPFLKNFFMDPAIIRAPFLVRFLLARFIAWKRGRAGGPAERAYAGLGGKSPLLDNTAAQARALQEKLNSFQGGTHGENIFTVHVAMRYWHPRSDAVVQTILKDRGTQVILVPLYPQFSTTTTGSSVSDWHRAARTAGLSVPTQTICCYPTLPGFVAASADRVATAYREFLTGPQGGGTPPRVLFSAHGLPVSVIAAGDPYQNQCEQSAKAIARAVQQMLGLEQLDWQVCYQSKVGPLKWTRPSTAEALQKAAKDHVGVILYPHAFVSEHVETLVEIDHEYRAMAQALGVPGFVRAGTVMTHPAFIAGLADLVMKRMEQEVDGLQSLAPADGSCQCGPGWKQCPFQKGS